MNKMIIVTDSTADLSDELIEKYNIKVVPLSIHIEGKTFLDRIELSPSEFIKKKKASRELPKSSQPSTGAFLEVYNKYGQEGYEIISIHMTGNMSGTVRSAESAAKMTKAKVTVIDSRFISKGLAFQVVEAARMAKDGKQTEEIIERLKEVRKQTRLFVVVDTLENLVKGGRIGKGKALIGSLLNIKPIASLEGGEYTPIAKVRSRSQVVKYLAKQFAQDVKGKTIRSVGIAHAEGYELAVNIKNAILELTGFKDVDIVETTPIISTHTGVGAIGFMYYFE
ncbi:DegV family protein [Bacillus aquiflavi]|uniref:DegV family protein n=1 Tax=Bacillus aquiflavi TaxID=2672567 RepID=UPI001CA9358F|nr:DegV family protein [Bacillus aquiflavi]UAC46955.1 DegV family protein [Bacillus aquiflavi]